MVSAIKKPIKCLIVRNSMLIIIKCYFNILNQIDAQNRVNVKFSLRKLNLKTKKVFFQLGTRELIFKLKCCICFIKYDYRQNSSN